MSFYKTCMHCGQRIKRDSLVGWVHTEPGAWMRCRVEVGSYVADGERHTIYAIAQPVKMLA